MCVCVCLAKPVAVELRCHATALILVIGKEQFRRAMLSCDSSCLVIRATNSAVPAVHAQICPKFSLNILCKTSLPARMKMIQLIKSRQSGHKSMGIFSDAQEQQLPQFSVRSG